MVQRSVALSVANRPLSFSVDSDGLPRSRHFKVSIHALSGILFLATMGQIMGDVMADTLVSERRRGVCVCVCLEPRLNQSTRCTARVDSIDNDEPRSIEPFDHTRATLRFVAFRAGQASGDVYSLHFPSHLLGSHRSSHRKIPNDWGLVLLC